MDADVAIVGGGLTGLWTAWYLLAARPGLKVVVLEKEIAGFGASGRNGGWCSALFPRSTASLERDARPGRRARHAARHGRHRRRGRPGGDARRASTSTTRRAARSTTPARAVQLAAARAEVDEAAAYGVDALEFWGSERVKAAGALGAAFDPACARMHPAKLVRGLADRRRGARRRRSPSRPRCSTTGRAASRPPAEP